jgi:ketosteroid isomerase-like protein
MAPDAELILPSASPAVYVSWSALWLEGEMLRSAGDADASDGKPSHNSWTDRYLVAVAVPRVRAQAMQAEREDVASVRPRLLAEPQVFAGALGLLLRADLSHAASHPSLALEGKGVTLAQVSELHEEVRRSWAALVASPPPGNHAGHESVFQSGFDAFQDGDLAAMRSWFAPDAVLTVPGRTPYSGIYRGLPEILSLLAHASDRLGIDSPQLTDLVPDGDALHATFTTAVHRGGRSLAVRFRQRLWFNDDGQIVRSVLTFEDEARLNSFFGDA